MKEVKLDMYNRLTIVNSLSTEKGDVGKLRKIMKILDAIEPSAEEKEAMGMKQVPNGGVQWDPEKGIELVSIKIDSGDFEIMLSILNAKNDWPADRRIVDMFNRLDAAESVSRSVKKTVARKKQAH